MALRHGACNAWRGLGLYLPLHGPLQRRPPQSARWQMRVSVTPCLPPAGTPGLAYKQASPVASGLDARLDGMHAHATDRPCRNTDRLFH